MRKLIIGVCLLMLISSCGGGKKKMDPFETLTEEIDSLTATPDTTEAMAAVEEEPMVPATADESFADFSTILPVMKITIVTHRVPFAVLYNGKERAH